MNAPRALALVAVALLILFTALFGLGVLAGVTDGAAVATWLMALEAEAGRAALAAVAVGLLAGDLLLPVPSSVVMLASGHALGLTLGTATNFVGAMASALMGQALCRRCGHAAFARLVGDEALPRAQALFDGLGAWAILLSRPVPMLTEIVSCMAGLTAMSTPRFAALSAAGTLPVALAYAWVGSRQGDEVMLPLAAALLAPAAAYALYLRAYGAIPPGDTDE